MKNIPIPTSSYISEFRTRPVLERRAASIHIHVDGEQGPSMAEVAGATLRALSSLLSQSNGSQVGMVLQATLDSLGQYNGWSSTEHCCWIAQKAVEWTQYQYRYAIPSRLIERLSEIQEGPNSASERRALAAMVKSVFSSPTPLVNVSTSDILSALMTLVLQRVAIDSDELVIPDLVDCIGSLGTHIYYADQIQDLACDMMICLLNIEVHGIGGRGRDLGRRERGRVFALRCLINAIGRLIHPRDDIHSLRAKSVEDVNSLEEKRSLEGIKECTPPSVAHEIPRPKSPNAVFDPASVPSATTHIPSMPHRSKVPVDSFQETLQFLCDEDFTIRADYARVLISFIMTEIRREGGRSEFAPSNGDKEEAHHNRRSSVLVHQKIVGPRIRQCTSSIPANDSSRMRFLHELHAVVYVLVTSACLSSHLSSIPASPSHSVDGGHDAPTVTVTVSPSTPLHDEQSGSPDNTIDTSQTSNSRRRSTHISSQTRKILVMRRMLDQANAQPKLPSPGSLAPPDANDTQDSDSSATASDFMHVLSILSAAHTQVPRRSLLTGVPMLRALENWCKEQDPSTMDKHGLLRQRAIKEFVARTWIVIGELWDISPLVHLAENVRPKIPLLSGLTIVDLHLTRQSPPSSTIYIQLLFHRSRSFHVGRTPYLWRFYMVATPRNVRHSLTATRRSKCLHLALSCKTVLD